ncbi:MFS transporter [Reichenbachiella sp. 5M10]|uniref:MFS transporter n=1 Tax=Reichenbachiella sp. 5M10 TaxID=1889772 RepID=UPI000C149163|nr:MFS transporter [Reichenbachiella sp. 5M10]PIB34036.1 MFS transporter [Reichenbachiella sp. 5M10]
MKVKGLRWWIIVLIFLATVINYIDRTAISVMWPGISEELGFTKHHYSIMLNVFMVAYAIGQSVSGRMFDKIGTRMGYVVSIMAWGISTAMHALASGLLSFGLFRVMLGVSEAGNWPGAVKSNAEWFPAKERAMAQGIFNAGASMGSVIAPPLIAMLYLGFGWRVTFVIVGSLVFLWVIPWLIINKASPKKHPWITSEEQEHILSDQPVETRDEDERALTLREILSHKEAWSVPASRFFLEPLWWLFAGWMPIYLADTYGFDVKEIGMFAWVPYVGAAIGSMSGGWFAGKLIAQGKGVDKARKTTISIGAVLMFLGLLATIFIANTPEKFVGIVAVVLFGFQFSISNVQTIPSDLLSGKSVGALAGFGGTVGLFCVIGMNFLIPFITETSYTPAFVIIGAFVPLSVIAIFVLCKEIKRIEIK